MDQGEQEIFAPGFTSILPPANCPPITMGNTLYPSWMTKIFAPNIQEHLLAIVKDGYIWAQDIVDYILKPEIQAKLNTKKQSISIQTAQHWLKDLEWHYGQRKKGMYIDGHE